MCSPYTGHATDSAAFDHELYSFLHTDTLSVDSLSPRSHSSLSGDEDSYSGKRRRSSYNSFALSPKRFKNGLYNITDEVMLPHSPESGIALSPPMTLYSQNPSCGKVWTKILEQPEEVGTYLTVV